MKKLDNAIKIKNLEIGMLKLLILTILINIKIIYD